MDTTPFVDRYRSEMYPLYNALAARLGSLLQELLAGAGIDIVKLEHRAKTPDSVREKLSRKQYESPASDIKDFAGCRIICYYADDVGQIAELIRSEFSVDRRHSVDKVEALRPDEFGYRSVHLVASLSERRAELTEWRQFRELVFEIQVRSALQHAWAAISHKLDYKVASDAPTELRRQLFRLSALLELADQEFSRLRTDMKAVRDRYKADMDRGEFGIPLDLDSITQYLRARVDLSELERVGEAVGMDKRWQQYSTAYRILPVLRWLSLKTVEELDSTLSQARPRARQLLGEFQERIRKHGGQFGAVGEDLVVILLLLNNKDRLGPGTDLTGLFKSPETLATLRELLSCG